MRKLIEFLNLIATIITIMKFTRSLNRTQIEYYIKKYYVYIRRVTFSLQISLIFISFFIALLMFPAEYFKYQNVYTASIKPIVFMLLMLGGHLSMSVIYNDKMKFIWW